MTFNLNYELWLTWFFELVLVIASLWTLSFAILVSKLSRLGPWIISFAWLGFTLVILYRWLRIGHGPFITMYEILLSNLWSLLSIWLLVYWRNPQLRRMLIFILPLFFLFMGWLLLARPGESFFPPTYQTIWLYVHVILGKIFFATLMIATALAVSLLAAPIYSRKIKKSEPSIKVTRELAGRLLVLALVFDTLMLVAGAIWAQDAWGRFWAWDPLETWSFVCWLSIGLALHIDLAWRLTERIYAWMVLAIFSLAFVTFYGVPFLSQAPHQGVI